MRHILRKALQENTWQARLLVLIVSKKKNMVQRGLGSHSPHGTRSGLSVRTKKIRPLHGHSHVTKNMLESK